MFLLHAGMVDDDDVFKAMDTVWQCRNEFV